MNDPVFLGLSMAQWELINSFSNWLSAIGTLAAVAISLWLATRNFRLQCKASVGVRLVIESGVRGPPPEILVFRIVNTGERTIRITGIGWRIGILRWRREAMQMFDRKDSSPMPIELAHGQEASWVVPLLPNDDGWLQKFANRMLLPHPRIQLATLRALFTTSVGKTFSIRPEKSVLRRLAETAGSNTK